jgi:hypothetical protein
MKMHRNSKLFLAAVFVGCASGLTSVNAGSVPLGPPSPIGQAIPSTQPSTAVTGFDPFTLSAISSGQGASVAVPVVADKSDKKDRSPGDKDKDHDHDGKGDNDNDGDGAKKGK